MEITPESIQTLLKLLTWQKIIQITVLLTVFLASWIVWENKNTIYNGIKVSSVESAETIIHVSPKSQNFMDNIFKRSVSPLVGIQVVSVNFRKNSRNTQYFYSTDPILRKDHLTYTANKLSDTPLFNDSEINNQRLINLVNGEFSCSDFEKTIAAKLYPNSKNSVKIVCGVSIPPYYGKFSGYINLYLSALPDANDMLFIKQTAREVSLTLYDNELSEKSVVNK